MNKCPYYNPIDVTAKLFCICNVDGSAKISVKISCDSKFVVPGQKSQLLFFGVSLSGEIKIMNSETIGLSTRGQGIYL